MKISIEWIRDYVELRETPDKLKEDLTMAGLVVESISEAHGNPVLEIEVTSNRPDCLCYIGVARELGALYDRPLRRPRLRRELRISQDRIPYSIEIQDPDLCPRYTG